MASGKSGLPGLMFGFLWVAAYTSLSHPPRQISTSVVDDIGSGKEKKLKELKICFMSIEKGTGME
jgi:hypothetical protein